MKCSFCGLPIERGTGKILVRKTGRILGFCSRRCEKNLIKLNRTPGSAKWTRQVKAND